MDQFYKFAANIRDRNNCEFISQIEYWKESIDTTKQFVRQFHVIRHSIPIRSILLYQYQFLIINWYKENHLAILNTCGAISIDERNRMAIAIEFHVIQQRVNRLERRLPSFVKLHIGIGITIINIEQTNNMIMIKFKMPIVYLNSLYWIS